MDFSLFPRDPRTRKWAVLLCLVAVTSLLFAQTLHTHLGQGSSSAEQTHCSVCAAIHGASVALFVAVLLITTPTTLSFRRSVFDLLLQSQSSGFSLFSRPPPAQHLSLL
jgi:hypothetical protein